MAQQTATEWLVNAIGYKRESGVTIINLHPDCDITDLIKRAKQIEENNLKNAMIYALDEDGHTGDWKIRFVNDYYNKTFDIDESGYPIH